MPTFSTEPSVTSHAPGGAVRRAAVLGSPIAHSLSPVLHEAAYAVLGLGTWSYTRVECAEDDLSGFVAGLGPEWAGLSLTMPLKRVALEVATEVSAEAEAIGAANTLLLAPGRRRAENTDAPGMADALREAGLQIASTPLVLGAGGTAQAALAALAAPGAGIAPLVDGPVTVLVRSPHRADVLRTTAERLGLALDVRPLDEAPTRLTAADLVISTLPKGIADPLAHAALRPGAVVFDVVYDPWPTALATAATAAGCRVVSGLDLLLHQAGHQVRLMTGREAPIEAMRAALALAR
ncbi:shikimate dehydrogenase [Cryptosporangium aurantiacum]|uniref:shikimate dehydrogenase n=1 Tax=Cryptosporangium aurantiacum TaxID=134849 RepID=UPI001C49F088|nr:shikimate dehydrogenase [Cryptosporangium aurantiacum]